MKSHNFVRVSQLLTLILLLSSVAFAQQTNKKQLTFWQKLLRFAGISATPSAQKAPGDEVVAGDIWLVQVGSMQALRLTDEGGYHSPIFVAGDKKILALKSDDVMEISVNGGQAKKLFRRNQVVKLIGANLDDPNLILVLIEDQNGTQALGFLTLKDGSVGGISSNSSEDSRRALTHAQGWERVYGSSKVYVKTEVKNDMYGSVEWSNVYLKQGNSKPQNVSQCNGVNCGQPSLSQKGGSVAFIKSRE